MKINKTIAAGLVLMSLNLTPALANTPKTEQWLVGVSSDALPGQDSNLNVEISFDLEIQRFLHRTKEGDVREYTPEAVSRSVVLYKKSGRDVLILKSKDFDPWHGGTFTLKYLTSGITGSYGTTELELQRLGNNWRIWVSDNSGRRPVAQIFLQKNTFLGNVIGIKRVIFR